VIDEVRRRRAALSRGKDAVGEVSLTVARKASSDVCARFATHSNISSYGNCRLSIIRSERSGSRCVYHSPVADPEPSHSGRVLTDDEKPVPSVTGLWPVAGWLEREVFDMFGVLFTAMTTFAVSSPIMASAGTRSERISRSPAMSRCVIPKSRSASSTSPVRLAQDFREFDFLSPWEGAEYILPGDEKVSPEAPGRSDAARAAEIVKK
jgi:NADH-quinone oxidoreductase subunit C